MSSNTHEQLLVNLAEQSQSRYYGKYRGIVRDVDDPENLGRVKAQVPELFGTVDLDWAFPVVPFAGPNHGLVVLPEVGDGVWIEFEAGDPSRPLWTGGWWGSGDLPSPGGTKTRVLVTTGGHKLVMDDDEIAPKVQLLHAGGAELTMTDNDITLKIGSTQIVLSSAGVNVNNGAFQVR
ncbi:hypothetical protein J5X98_15115 [Leptothermofonsia sichuanensis E412]|jgi:uncharacterized protein involved in type VI secretion and phage assembly|uniref:phage baseplate assembly protein V n=1 Tax=Leptothermofonsia sichuanensis TaxID=2917832 RepID=UPI001CA6B22B|nr:phage baseplate assembly protein V [Leptothermofonsia sichuanensis]QZZ18786.1 hypothetical protein J5X98_15115 [Leptothermofonsia sichuanensis E412]